MNPMVERRNRYKKSKRLVGTIHGFLLYYNDCRSVAAVRAGFIVDGIKRKEWKRGCGHATNAVSRAGSEIPCSSMQQGSWIAVGKAQRDAETD